MMGKECCERGYVVDGLREDLFQTQAGDVETKATVPPHLSRGEDICGESGRTTATYIRTRGDLLSTTLPLIVNLPDSGPCLTIIV